MTVGVFLNNFVYAYLSFNIIYYGLSLLCFLADIFPINDYSVTKTQVKRKMDALQIYYKTAYTVFMNVSVYSIPFLFVSMMLINIEGRDEIEGYGEMIVELAGLYLLSDLAFYGFHKLLHHPQFYKYHKKHHEIRAPVGFASLYMSVVDMYIGNMFPVAMPMVLLSTPLPTCYLWVFIVLFDTIVFDHSGYKTVSEHHDRHHRFFNCNYGTTPLFDRLFGSAYV